MKIYLLLLLALFGCSTDPSEREPIIDILDHPDSEYYYHFKVVAREPLPYLVTVRMNTRYKGFGAAPDDFQCCGKYIESDTNFVTVTPDRNEYVGRLPRVLEAPPLDRPDVVNVVASVEVEIFVITDVEISNRFLEIEREKECVYTVGQSTLTLGSHLPLWKE